MIGDILLLLSVGGVVLGMAECAVVLWEESCAVMVQQAQVADVNLILRIFIWCFVYLFEDVILGLII